MEASELELDQIDIERQLLLVESAYQLDLIASRRFEMFFESNGEKEVKDNIKKQKQLEERQEKTKTSFFDKIKNVLKSIKKFISDMIAKIKSVIQRGKKTNPNAKVLEPDENAEKKLTGIKKVLGYFQKFNLKTPEGRKNIIRASEALTAVLTLGLTVAKTKKYIGHQKVIKCCENYNQTMAKYEGTIDHFQQIIENPPEELTPEEKSILNIGVDCLSTTSKELNSIWKHYKYCMDVEEYKMMQDMKILVDESIKGGKSALANEVQEVAKATTINGKTPLSNSVHDPYIREDEKAIPKIAKKAINKIQNLRNDKG